MVLTDGTKTCYTPAVKVSNVSSGKAGVWLWQIGDRQEFGNFELSRTPFAPAKLEASGPLHRVVSEICRLISAAKAGKLAASQCRRATELNSEMKTVKHLTPLATLGPLLLTALLLLNAKGLAQPSSTNRPPNPPPAAATNRTVRDPIALLRDEGTNRSQVAEIFSYLTDVIGPRLTASPQCRRANDWTRDKLASWGLTNAHLEGWGPFGRGWAVKRFSAQIVEPQSIPLVAWPKAWSHGSEWPLVGEVVFLDAKTEADLEKFKGKLKGAIVLISSPRDISLRFDPLAVRLNETNLLRLANAAPSARPTQRRPAGDARRPAPTNAPAPPARTNETPSVTATNQPAARPPRPLDPTARLRFAVQEGAALTASISSSGDGGALMVGTATVVPLPDGRTNRPPSSVRAWATNAPSGPPQIVLAAEQYNRLVRMIQAGEKLKMAVEVQTQFSDQDLMAYNTLAEIPGGDRVDEIVMLGAHLDSAPGGTGATDNAAGVAVCMEAIRLIKALNLQPRRTIRIGLWTGEEEGLYGSRAYVGQHFGYYTNQTNVAVARSPKDASQQPASASRPGTERKLIEHPDHKQLSAYYNLDNGAGRIRGIYLQGNEALRPIFREWLQPFRELGAETISSADTGGTDHLSFVGIGLPGFQFIQDPVEYWRSYHTSIDVRERAPVADLQQATIVMAAFVYQTAMRDEKLPRKPIEQDTPRRR
jgi:hypothetical protein